MQNLNIPRNFKNSQNDFLERISATVNKTFDNDQELSLTLPRVISKYLFGSEKFEGLLVEIYKCSIGKTL